MKRDDRYHFQFEDEVLIAFGRVALGSSYIEASLRWMFNWLASNDRHISARISAGANFHWLVDHGRALASYRLPEALAKDVDAWLVRARAAYDRRSRIIHSEMYVSVEGDTIRHGLMKETVRKKRFQRDEWLIELPEIHEVAIELEREGLRGVELLYVVRGVLGVDGNAGDEL